MKQDPSHNTQERVLGAENKTTTLPPGKHNRSFDDYSHMLFDGLRLEEKRCVYAVFGLPASGSGESGLLRVINSLHHATAKNKVHWADYGAGQGIAQRDAMLLSEEMPGILCTTSIDVYPYTRDDYVATVNQRALVLKGRKVELEHHTLTADISTAKLVRLADLSTSVYSIPYWDDPLNGIANMYNQLVAGGVMAIVTDNEYPWTCGIRDDNPIFKYNTPSVRFIRALHDAGIKFALVGETQGQGDLQRTRQFHGLYIRRKQSTSLNVLSEVVDIKPYPENEQYKIVSYGGDPGTSPIEVV